MDRKRDLLNEFDWVILVAYAMLVLLGCISIFSVSSRELDITSFWSAFNLKYSFGKQMIWVGIALLISLVILLLDSKVFTSMAYVVYTVSIILLITVLFLGELKKGNKSWFSIGSIGIQPAELAKFATALTLAKLLSALNFDLRNARDRVLTFTVIGTPALLVLLQGDLGSTLVFFSFAFVLYREGFSPYILIIPAILLVDSVLTLKFGFWIVLIITLLVALGVLYYLRREWLRYVAIVSVLFLVLNMFNFSIGFVFEKVLKPHQRARIEYTLGIRSGKNKTKQPYFTGGFESKSEKKESKFDDWNVRQSIIAIGSGGLLGKGFMNGTQTRFDFVPEQETDFIFCTIGEEEGFWGACLVIVLYMILLLRLVRLADKQRSKFSRIYGYSIVSVLFFHFVINIGMTIGLVPVIGIPLPFISYGGSSLLAFTMMVMTMVKLDADRLHVLR